MQLLAAGYRTPQDIAAADPTTLSEQIEHMFPKNAKKLIHAAKVRPRMCSCTVNYCLSPLSSPPLPSPLPPPYAGPPSRPGGGSL